MKAFGKIGLNCTLAALLWAVCGSAQQAQAQRVRWEGSGALGPTRFVRNPDGSWSERNRFNFTHVESTYDYILLHDYRRDVRVALFDDRVEMLNNLNGEWLVLFRGRWVNVPIAPMPLPPPSPPTPTGPSGPPRLPPGPRGFDVKFTRMEILDDKEGGKGDWRLTATFGGHTDRTLISKREGGSGATFDLSSSPRGYVREAPFTVSARVYEYDGGLESRWEFVGHKEQTVYRPGPYFLEFNNGEGRVKVWFEVTIAR